MCIKIQKYKKDFQGQLFFLFFALNSGAMYATLKPNLQKPWDFYSATSDKENDFNNFPLNRDKWFMVVKIKIRKQRYRH